MIQQTSLIAFTEIKQSLGVRQLEVYRFLSSHLDQYFSNTELSYALELPINRITPRIYELRRAGLVKSYGKRYCRITGKEVLVWQVV